MSHSQSTEIKRPENLVRLKIDGAKTSVNTLWDQETARGVSLVCPFPALEVDIPVHFGAASNMNTGAIHRIGVEDDPETGLPRLRLSIRTRETRPTVIAKTSESLIKAVKIDTPPDDETGEQVVPAAAAVGPMVKPACGSWSDFLSEIADPDKDEAAGEEGYSMKASSDQDDDADPSWAACGEMPFPEDIRERVLTRRRYKMVRHVAGAFVLGMLAASLYLFDRAGVVSFGKMKDRIAAAVLGTETENTPAATDALASNVYKSVTTEVTPEQISEVAEDAPSTLPAEPVIAAVPTSASYTPGPNPLMDGIAATESAQPAAAEAPAPEAAVEEETAAVAETAAETAENTEQDGAAMGDINLLLPTRWPVEYATAYRVREPNGVVVDVPGGLVKREGWLENGKENPMVRSIKSIQRESGARFIVYVNGELPRFITTPAQNGVALRLYFDGDEMKTAAVASLAK